MRTNATDFKNHLGRYLESSIKGPIIVEKSGRASAVLISIEEFEKLSRYEEFYWSALAKKAESDGYLGTEETASKLKKYAYRAGLNTEDENETARHNEAS